MAKTLTDNARYAVTVKRNERTVTMQAQIATSHVSFNDKIDWHILATIVRATILLSGIRNTREATCPGPNIDDYE